MRNLRKQLACAGFRGALGLFCLMAMAAAVAGPVGSPLQRPALMVAQPERSYLLGIAEAGERLVAVGERGIILVSDDQGGHWRQVPSPVSVTLTTVRFADARQGYAVGHGGSVLTTRDGGQTWTLSLDGHRAAEVLLAAAQAKGDARGVAEAQRLVADGPDKPLLDVLVRDARHAFVVGAYGLALATDDAGEHWHAALSHADNPGGLHLNAVRASGERMVIVGEQGLVLLSDDAGKSFRNVETPYAGSFFTAELLPGNRLLVAGLRGNAWVSDDAGSTWTALPSPVDASITASTIDAAGAPLLASQAGLLLHEQGGRLVPVNRQPLAPVNNVLAARQGSLFVLGDQGVRRLSVGEMQ
ncbi:WD40/YVTN/BNR-like repeat-containing protein [Pseudomonas wadenswilerensis]